MGKALVAACTLFTALAATGCQGMYDHKAETLKTPPRRPPPKVVITEEQPTFVDACNVNFSGTPTKKRQAPASQQLTAAGNSSLQNATPTSARPATSSSVKAIQDAIDKYRQALQRDPYNAEATLKLALAYDRVLRKGCALALLHRLETLASNPTFQPDAEPMVDLVVQNPHWFQPYGNDALKAVGK